MSQSETAIEPSVAGSARSWHMKWAEKLLLVFAVFAATNLGLKDSLPIVAAVAARGQWKTFIPLVVIWVLTAVTLFVVAMDRRLWVRLFWGIIIAASSAFTAAYENLSGSQLSMFDILSLWASRHEASRAAEQFQQQALIGAVIFMAVLAIVVWPPVALRALARKIGMVIPALPLLPLAFVADVYYGHGGVTYMPMPSQYNAASLAGLLAYTAQTEKIPERQPVTWQPGKALAPRHIIMMMDESIRADAVSLLPGNPFTPHIAARAGQFINFGPAASAGDCSNYSNALVRFGASREDVVTSASVNATLFAYAKKAGYRTVFIDAQAAHILNGNKIQNFMTLKEKAEIDGFYALRPESSPQADYELNQIIARELQSPQPVFIYANKNGAHFPYDVDYPPEATPFLPTLTQAGDTVEARTASYRNAIAWSVDLWMEDLFKNADLSNTVMIYTGDHGQRFVPGGLTHCQTDNVDPVTGIVPLLVYAPPGPLHDQLAAAAPLSAGKASHFQIAPTLYRLMGYSAQDIATRYDESLFTGTAREPAFTTGDVFGVFKSPVHLTPVSLSGHGT